MPAQPLSASPAQANPGARASLALLALAAVLLSLALACATPFAALAALAAARSRREALSLAALAWLLNQAIGFGLLGYPLDPPTLGWGLAIGAGALAAALAAALVPRRGAGGPVATALLRLGSAFTAYEAVLCAAAFLLPGGADAFAPPIVLRLLLINLAALAGLSLLQAGGHALVRIASGRDRAAAPRGRPA
jgi:hypothetical protein